MIKSFLEQFLFFPNTTIKKTPMFHKIEFEDVLLENKKNNDKYNGWFITSNQKNSISKNKKNPIENTNAHELYHNILGSIHYNKTDKAVKKLTKENLKMLPKKESELDESFIKNEEKDKNKKQNYN